MIVSSPLAKSIASATALYNSDATGFDIIGHPRVCDRSQTRFRAIASIVQLAIETLALLMLSGDISQFMQIFWAGANSPKHSKKCC
ncbi:hypothetical protein IQ269_04575 [Tychonema sp. LEGE 07199]|uniref:hypothetical protein n=1 Tax=unclassified Tychonema TaxID=2642144 RepID=UPI0018802D42|nr:MULTISPECIES: hypothetical protein [unclassified Tychonema]MBE9120096.1 hypothetical protein [Tychonema sp. LEGE 07199]MBE9132822.1 hypothetical protein [Tychonema sp. LEGE 07196]